MTMTHKLLCSFMLVLLSISSAYLIYAAVISKNYIYIPFLAVVSLFCLGFSLLWLYVARTGD